MTGEELKLSLAKSGKQLKDLAQMVGMSQQNFSNTLRVSDVKSGFLERLCDALNVDLGYFYQDTKYYPCGHTTIATEERSIATHSGTVSVSSGGLGDHIGTQNNYGLSEEQKKDSITTLTETVATLTKELDTSQQQKSHLIEVVATSQQQILQLTELIDRLTK